MNILFAENSLQKVVELKPETIKDLALWEIVDHIAGNESEKRIIITTPAGSIEQIKQNEEEYMAAIEGYEEKVESLEKAIAELDAEIDKIYNEHFDDN